MGNLKGPLIYDSLDKPNRQSDEPREAHKSSSTSPKINNASMVAILSGIMCLLLLFTYVLFNLEHKAAQNDTFAIVALYTVFSAAIIALVTILVGTSWYVIQYLRRVVKTKGMYSMQQGPYFDVEEGFSNAQFDKFAEMMYAVQQERARNSKYQGVQTLTLDESQAMTTTTNGATQKPPEQQKQKDETLQPFGLNMLDTLND